MEIEIKIPLKARLSVDSIISDITKKYGTPSEEIIQIDTYFTSPISKFWKSDEALRLRQIQTKSGNKKNEITYKGPKQGKNMKIREEITIEASNSNKARRILQNLGFQAFATIKKKRKNWAQNNFIISFDIVEDLGSFLEIEITTPSVHSEDIAKKKEKIINLAKEIVPNWSGEDERKSYLELKIEKQISNQGK